MHIPLKFHPLLQTPILSRCLFRWVYAWLLMASPLVSAANEAYITNQGSHDVSVLNLQDGKVVSTIPVGKAPVGIAVSAKLQRAFISNVDSQSISVIDTSQKQVVAEWQIPGSPVAIALSPDDQTLYVADWYLDRVLAINTDDPTKQQMVEIGKAPAGLVVSRDGKTLYVSNRDSNDIGVIDTETMSVKGRIAAGAHPFGLTLSPDGNTLYAVNVYEDTVSMITLFDQHQAAQNQADGNVQKIKVGSRPYCAVSSPDGKTLYVTNTQGDSVSVIDIHTREVTATIAVGGFPEGIDYDARHHRLYVASWFENLVTIIDAKTHKVMKNVDTGQQSRAYGRFIMQEFQ